MSRSIYSLNALLLDNPGLFIPHAEDEFYPHGPVARFDKAIMLGWYESPVYYRVVADAVVGSDVVARRESKHVNDEVRLSDWVDARLQSDPWTEQSGNASTWTEA